jgi:hypothetical protein
MAMTVRGIIFSVVIAAALAVTVTLVALATQAITVEFVAIDRNGTRTVLGPAPISTFAPRVSPDGRLAAFTTSGGALNVVDLPQVGSPRRVASLPDAAFIGWDDRNERIFYIAAPGRNQALFFTRVDGSGHPSVPLRDPARGADNYSTVLGGLTVLTLGSDYDVWFFSEREKKSIPIAVIPGSN